MSHKSKKDGMPPPLSFDKSEVMNPRKRVSMEDCDECSVPFRVKRASLEGLGFFGVYDGHGGRDIAEFLQDNLAKNLRESNGASIVSKCEALPVAK